MDKEKRVHELVEQMREGEHEDALAAVEESRRRGWLTDGSLRRVNLDGASLRGADLSGAILIGTELSGADLYRTNLHRANLSGADLSGAILYRANLYEANLYEANLSNAELSGADLNEADLSGADLSGAILIGTELSKTLLDLTWCRETSFVNVDLSKARALEFVKHSGRSYIDIQTLYNSKGRIPEVFLRGCGVPERFIRYMPSLVQENAIEFYSCFISYSHADKAFARRVHDTLQGRGIRCWLDEHEMLPGDDPHKEIDRGIRLWDKVLLCASKDSLTSWWVDREIDGAFRKEQRLMKERGEQVLALIPLNLDGYLFSPECASAKKNAILSRLAANFEGWKKDNDIFEREIKRVIRALRTERYSEPPPESKL